MGASQADETQATPGGPGGGLAGGRPGSVLAGERPGEGSTAGTGQPTARHRLNARLVAVLCGVVLAACVVAGVFVALPSQATHDEGREYGYVYSGAKSSSTQFTKSTLDEGSLLVFGSSEFSTPASLVPQVPANTFATTDYGVHLTLVGEAYDQSLWHTIALGAYAADDGVPRGKVVLSVGPGWFVDGGMDAETFQTRFSYSLYAQFCDNDEISQETKDYVAARLLAYGIDENEVYAASGSLPQDVLNDLAYTVVDDLRLRRELAEVRAGGSWLVRSEDPEEPDFDAMRTEALADAQERSTNNDWGLEDAFYAEQLAPVLDGIEGYRADETYSDTSEYEDLACFLDVANACGIEVLVVISPVCGPYYDYIGIDADTRAACYERIRAVCEEGGAQVADFSDREYEKYFLYDIVHFGWTGWVDVEQSIYEFATQGEDEEAGS